MSSSDPSAPAVEVRELVREFKGGIRAVDGLDLEVMPGEIYGFLGPNGAGKTTSVRILTTLLRPTAGSARVAGHDVVAHADAVRRSIGVALQEAAIDPLMTGRELLRMQGALHGLRGPAARARAGELLERVGLTQAADRRVGGYSGGMRRRLDLALALVHRPLVVFLDEPTTGLDPTSRGALWREVRSLNDDGTTVFLTTQYLEEAELGARYPGGVGAALAAIVLAAITAIGIGGIAAAIALRTGSLSLLQSIFPFVFVLLFTAPAFFPRELLSPVLRDAAAYNPLTHVVEAVRGLLTDDPGIGDPWTGLAAAAALALATTALATMALAQRLRAT
jgi:ABC-type Na+ transport system ATPase subunit NatA